MRAYVGLAVLIAILAYESAERALSRLLFVNDYDIKDWRRRRHPANCRREWVLLGRLRVKG